MSRRTTGRSTMSRIYDIGGADLALRYHEISERARRSAEPAPAAPTEARAPAAPARPAPAALHRVFVNGLRLDDDTVAGLERATGMRVADGDYWYDRLCGAWGAVGGPVAGFIRAGLPLGGPLHPQASGGGTPVFVNGRALHPADLARLAQVMPVWPGYYWADAMGNVGRVGQAAFANLGAVWRSPPPAPRFFA